jgi:hypothetical protein
LLIDLEEMKVEGEVIFPANPTEVLMPDVEGQESIGHDVEQFFRLSQGRLLTVHGRGLRTRDSDWVLRVWDAGSVIDGTGKTEQSGT